MFRPQQWSKQVLVLMPMVAIGNNIEVNQVRMALIASIAFTFAAAFVYTVNDLYDLESDRNDITKRSRPIASRSISKSEAKLWLVIFFSGVLVFSRWINQNSTLITILIVIYISINFVYSKFKLKEKYILGIAIVAFGFPLRFLVGTLAVGLPVSYWAFILLMQLALLMLSGKRYQTQRRNNLVDLKNSNHYEFWLLSLVVYCAMFAATYAGFISDNETQITWGKNHLLLSTIPMGLSLVRYLEMTTHSDKYKSSDVTNDVIRDKILIFLFIIYLFILLMGKISAS